MLKENSLNRKYKNAFSLLELSIVIVVMAILIASITQGQKLLNMSKLANAQALTASSPVTATDGLTLWLETTAAGSIQSRTNGFKPENGDDVNLWKDRNNQSITPLNSSQSNTDTYPKYVKNSFNSLPAIEFDGVNDMLEITNNKSLSGFDNMTIFIVLSLSSGGSSSSSIGVFVKGQSGGGATNPAYAIQINGSNNNINFFVSNSSDTRVGSTSTALLIDSPTIFSAIHDSSKTTNGFTAFRNGTSTGASSTTVTSVAMNTGNLTIGRQKVTADNSRFFKGRIAEIIFFSRTLTDNERIEIESYLSKKWGITI